MVFPTIFKIVSRDGIRSTFLTEHHSTAQRVGKTEDDEALVILVDDQWVDPSPWTELLLAAICGKRSLKRMNLERHFVKVVKNVVSEYVSTFRGACPFVLNTRPHSRHEAVDAE